ncbi:MAG: hypothetical protein ABWY45_19380 [Mycobacterium sp.]
MAEPLVLRGIELRYALTNYLSLHGERTVQELVEGLIYLGFGFHGRPSKAVSDALRWEVRLGRVYARRRALYGPGEMPRSTAYRIDRRVTELRERAALSRPEVTSKHPPWQHDQTQWRP